MCAAFIASVSLLSSLTLTRAYGIRTYKPDAGDHGEFFRSGLVKMILTLMHILSPSIIAQCQSCLIQLCFFFVFSSADVTLGHPECSRFAFGAFACPVLRRCSDVHRGGCVCARFSRHPRAFVPVGRDQHRRSRANMYCKVGKVYL